MGKVASNSILIIWAICTILKGARAATTEAPPPFFLQDPTDNLCMAGEDFKRCSIDTLFYVQGEAGKYQIHKRARVASDDDDSQCLTKKSCNDHTKPDDVKVAKCSHCGAQDWNILGDAETGYVLTTAESQSCVYRDERNKVRTTPCNSTEINYTPLQLRFASDADIKTMSSPGARLVAAAAEGDKKVLQDLLKEGIDILSRDWDGLTALIPAASAGHLEVCKFLIQQGVDINGYDKDGITALMEASIMGNDKIVGLLLDKGAEVDAKATSEVTALWLAASEGQTECIKLLLKKGADATNARSDGISALMTASLGGHAEAVKLLLENGADATTVDKDGLTPLMNAAENGTVALLEVLTNADGGNSQEYLNAVSATGFTALIIASAHGHTEAVRHLLNAGADVNAGADTNVTPLMFAAASDKVDVLKVLVEEGKADIVAKHSNGGTALLEATTGGAVDAIRFLIEQGAPVDIVDDDGVTPLMAIASFGSAEGQNLILDALKTKMSDQELKDHINLFSKSGGSTIMFAAAGGHIESTKQLLELGADPHAIARATPDYLEKLEKMIEEGTVSNDEPNVDGVTALHVAAQGGHLEVVQFLIDTAKVNVDVADDESRTPLLLAIKGGYEEVASALIEAGAEPNIQFVDDDDISHNILFDALMVENEEFALFLIENGADLYYKDEKNVSTLLQASHRGFPKIVEALLIKHGASGNDGYVDDASDDGITPLIAAASEGHLEVVKLLVAAKANVDYKDKDQTTALMAAAARGHLDVSKELLASGASVNEQNVDGHTALMFAYNGKNQVETLWERYSQLVKEADEGEKKDIDDNGTGPIIREALDKHIALIDTLFKNGADPAVKDKEGHTAKDFDYHPDTDTEILHQEAKAEKLRDESKNEL